MPQIWMMSVYENHNAHKRRKSRGIRGDIRRFSYTNWPGPLTKKWTVSESQNEEHRYSMQQRRNMANVALNRSKISKKLTERPTR